MIEGGISENRRIETAPTLPINRCRHCRRRLFDGFLFGRIKCPWCNAMNESMDKTAVQSYDAAQVK